MMPEMYTNVLKDSVHLVGVYTNNISLTVGIRADGLGVVQQGVVVV